MRVIDSHTGGEPTRVIVDGGPPLGNGTLAERRQLFAEKYDDIRSTVILEPRGSDALVGALLCAPTDPDCVTGIIFFNNTGYLSMCGHGTLGVAVTLAYLGDIGPGQHRFETPVGVVTVELLSENHARIDNVASYCYRRDVTIDVEELGPVCGDIAWGGNWFFLVNDTPAPLTLKHIDSLTAAAQRIKHVLIQQKITGPAGECIDHIEFFGPPESAGANSRNFVLCPGGAYDRSPCGTGTSAKLACLAAQGKLKPGEVWVQESIIGSRFQAQYRVDDAQQIIPSITGTAYICGEATLIQQRNDPFAKGIR